MKMYAALILIPATVLSVSLKSQASDVLTATGRTTLLECHKWVDATLEEKQFLQDKAAEFAQTEMYTTCNNQGTNLTPVVLDVSPVGYKCQSFAKVGLYLMTVSFICTK
jgi:hypothetical protein